MTYTKVFKRGDGSAICSLTLHDSAHPWTLHNVVWNNRQDFLDTEGATAFEVLDSKGKRIVEIKREEFDAGAAQYRVEFYEIPKDRGERIPTEKKDYVAAWSQPLAMALAKEMVPHYPPATGFALLDMVTERELDVWDKRFDD